jgi:hypothetical protein
MRTFLFLLPFCFSFSVFGQSDRSVAKSSVVADEQRLRKVMKADGLSDGMINTLIGQWKELEKSGRQVVTTKLGNPFPMGLCSDIGVENGWNSWEGTVGTHNATGPPVFGGSFVNPPAAPNFAITSGNSVDPCTPGTTPGAPSIPVVCLGFGNNSIQIGQPQTTGCVAEQLRFPLTVTAGDTNFVFSHAVVIQDAGHSVGEQPFVSINILDMGGNPIPCGSYTITGGPNLPDCYPAACGFGTYYRPWKSRDLNLSPYIGQTLMVVITNADCSQCGHYAHSYWDFSCGSVPVQAPQFCTGQQMVLCAQDSTPGMTFQWYKDGTVMPNCTMKCVTINPAYGDTFTVATSPIVSCSSNLLYIPNDTCVSTVYVTISSTANAVCSSQCTGTATANVNGGFTPYTYSWNSNPVQTTAMATGLCTGAYTVTVTDSIGVTGFGIATIVTTASPSQPAICMVTVDSLSFNNVIIWDKSAFAANGDSFLIYREISTNNYQPIGAVAYNSLSLFTDTVRTLYFPNTGNPNAGTYRYKITVKDTCAVESVFSPYHNTIFIINTNGNFSWTQPYTIEGTSNPVNAYVLMRDNLSNGTWQAVNSVSGTQQNVTDPAYSAWQATASWRVQTLWNISCTPSIKNPTTAAFASSYSNIQSTAVAVGVNEFTNTSFSVFPVPASGNLYLEFGSCGFGTAEVSIYTVLGSSMIETRIPASGRQKLDVSGLSKGVYFVKLTTPSGTSTKKIVVEK